MGIGDVAQVIIAITGVIGLIYRIKKDKKITIIQKIKKKNRGQIVLIHDILETIVF